MIKEGLLVYHDKSKRRLPRKKKNWLRLNRGINFKMCKQDWNSIYIYIRKTR